MNILLKKATCLAISLLAYSGIWAESSATISGSVTSAADGEPLIGVTVRQQGTDSGTSTDADGRFSLPLKQSSSQPILLFSYIGYQSRQVSLKPGQTTLDVKLETSDINIDEVVVVGYGTARRATLSSAITTVGSKDFVKGAVQSPMELLKGRVAGLQINTTSGDPNTSNIQVMLRGTSTLTASQSPLVIIDGFPGDLATLSVDDIQSIDVLKDGSAAAIYGTRGSNGVIIVTTRRGADQEGRCSVDYHGYVSLTSQARKIDTFSPDEYRRLDQTTNGFFTPVDHGHSTDWNREVFRTAFSQTHNLSVRAGNTRSNYIGTLEYCSNEGIVRGTKNETVRLRMGFNRSIFNDRITISANLSDAFSTRHWIAYGSLVHAARNINPTESPYLPSGDYARYVDADNPLRQINEFTSTTRTNALEATGRITYSPIAPLTLTLTGGYTNFFHLKGEYGTHKFDTTFDGQAWRNASNSHTANIEAFAQYSQRFGLHDITALAGYSYLDYLTDGFSLYNCDFPTELLQDTQVGAGLGLTDGRASMDGYKNMWRLISFFGRLNYSFAERYILAASIRHEGSTKFGVNHKWGNFWAISGAWRISQEQFMASTRSWLNELKLRVGYGITGNVPSSPYLSQLRYGFGSPMIMDGKYVYPVSPTANANPDLRWEEKKELNIGLDFSLLNHRLWGNIDYYSRRTSGLLYWYQVPVPPNLASETMANVGDIQNHGIELALGGTPLQSRDWNLTLTGTFSYNSNRLKRLSNSMYRRDFLELGSTGAPVQKSTHLVREGGRIGDFYGWRSVGMDSNGSWIIDGGKYGDNDSRQIIGNGIPKINASLNINLSWRNFDLGISLRGAFDYQILNQYRMLWENFARGADHNFPRQILRNPYNQYVATAPAYVSYYVENGDFLKLDNLTLGYTFRFSDKRNPLRSLRLYASALNLCTFTNYRGADPEVGITGLTPGVDYENTYPTTRTFTFGLKLGF